MQVFGDMAISGVGHDMKGAISEGAQNLENMLDSQRVLQKVRQLTFH